jgi:hypothetical protein
VTPGLTAHSIDYVFQTIRTGRELALTKLLTKRRAVDFCHVATAICCPGGSRPAA